MEPLELVRLNLLSPMVLSFLLGIFATLARSDLRPLPYGLAGRHVPVQLDHRNPPLPCHRAKGVRMSEASGRRTTLQLVTIIGEAVLEESLLRDLRELGARGWSTSHARGEGSRGTRTSGLEGGNIRIETLVSPAVAERILARLTEHYFPNYAVVAYTHPAEVVRGDKYV